MKKQAKIISLILALIVLSGILFFSLIQNTITGKIAEEYDKNENYYYTYTKAICTETYCQDYEITCNGNKTISKTPITGMIFHDAEWKDPRNEERINGFCNISLEE